MANDFTMVVIAMVFFGRLGWLRGKFGRGVWFLDGHSHSFAGWGVKGHLVVSFLLSNEGKHFGNRENEIHKHDLVSNGEISLVETH